MARIRFACYDSSIVRRRSDVVLALGCLLLALACRRAAPLPALERPLERLARPTVDGTPLDVGALAGKVVVVNFWSPG